jgi:hypothetical protein
MCEPEIDPTTMPPIIPAMRPLSGGAPLATAMPRQSGNATKNTTKLADRSALKFSLEKYFIVRF